MRKILFNKFAVFILYGLLSVAVITLAQLPVESSSNSKCPLAPPAPPSTNGQSPKIIGYIKDPNTIQPTQIAQIQWNYYDYISVIAYPKINPPWNDIHPPNDLSSFNNTIAKIKDSAAKTKILLSIRNFDPLVWPNPNNPNDNGGYGKIIAETMKTINALTLDGVDIEYPGMRGRYCKGLVPDGPNGPPVPNGPPLWDNSKDKNFLNFIKGLHDQLGPLNKTLILTVGSGDSVIGNGLNGLNNYINYLNIETYHYSFYQNNQPNDRQNDRQNDRVNSYPNAPFSMYGTAHNAWFTSIGIGNSNIIMGVDLGNTFQIINNQTIQNSITVQSDVKSPIAPPLPPAEFIYFCPGGDELVLYTYPWSKLVTEINSTTSNGKCYSFIEWEGKFDDTSSTPWLFRLDRIPGQPPPPDTQNYDFVSYEDFHSLNIKLNYVTSRSLGGVSISDVTYDVNDNNSLVKHIQEIFKSTDATPSESGSTGNNTGGTSPSSSVAATPTNDNPTEGNNRKSGVIAGAVIGSIFGLAIIGGIAFFGYKNRDKLPFGPNQQYSKNMSYNPGTFNQPMIIPNNSPRMVLPDTAAIPVAPSYVTAMFDFIGKEENDLSFKKGDKIEVLERGDGPNDWWVGRVNGAVGEFPGNYVRE